MELTDDISFPLEKSDKSGVKSSLSQLLLANSSDGSTLMESVCKNKSTEIFLRLMGIMWTTNNSSILCNLIQCLWSFAICVGLALMVFSASYYLVAAFILPRYNMVFYLLYGITLFGQSVTLCFALREMMRRLHNPATIFDSISLEFSQLIVAYVVFWLSVLISIVLMSVSLLYFSSKYMYLVFLGMYGEISLSCILTACLFFICCDCNVCYVLLEKLIKAQDAHQLSIDQYLAVKDEIESRHSSCQWVNNAIVFVAILDIITVITISFIYGAETPVVALYTAALFLKEIPFLLVVYWQVAQVNEKSALLTRRLGCKQWDKELGIDYQRVSVLVSALSSPISYSIAGMKLKRRDLMWQAFAWLVAFVVSIVKSIIESRL